MDLSDSVFNETNSKTIAEVAAIYETAKKNHQIELLEKESKIKSLELDNEKKISNIIVVILLFTLLMVIILYLRNREKHKTNLEISEQKNKVERLFEEVKIKNLQLEDSEKELKLINATKDKFLSIISHDLRNPLNAQIGLSDLLYKDYDILNYSERKEIIETIRKSSKGTYELLENLLQWALSQRGLIDINYQKISVSDLLKNNVESLKSIANKKNIRIKYNNICTNFAISDKNTISLVVRNLMTNSIKFTGKGGVIKILDREVADEIIVSIEDNGTGISNEDIDKLFRIDIQKSTVGTSKEKGSGLGLILCKEFVEKNNGRIWVERNKNVGSKFSFSLPKA